MSAAGFNAGQLSELESHALAVVRDLSVMGMSFFRSAQNVHRKSDGSLVGEADRAIELKAREALSRWTPSFGFVGEEFGTLVHLKNHQPTKTAEVKVNDAELSGLHSFEHSLDERPEESLNLDEDTYWILDPIDGTINFLSHVPLWSTLLSLVHKGRPVLGVVAFPALDEVFVASLGNGARHGRLFLSHEKSAQDAQWKSCQVGSVAKLSEAVVSYSTPQTFAYRGIDSLLAELQKSSRECRTHSDAFGYTRILTGGIDLMIDPLVAPYDVAALQILFDETPGAVFTTLQGHEGDSRYRMGSVVAAANDSLSGEFLQSYRSHLISTSDEFCLQRELLNQPVLPEKFQPTFELKFEHGSPKHAAKVWARAIETAIASFLIEHPKASVEDVSVLLGTGEAAMRSFSNGRNEGPPGFSASSTFHIRAIVSGGAGLVTGTPDFELDPVNRVRTALDSAWAQRSQSSQADAGKTLSSRGQVISHLGHHPWATIRFAESFQSVSELIQQQHLLKHDERIHSIKSRLSLSTEYRWQYFMDSSQQTFVTRVCQISTNATCSESGEKRSAYGRYLKNHFPDTDTLRVDLSAHFRKLTQQSIALLSAELVPEDPEYDYLAVDADLLGLILHEAIGHAAEGDLIQTCASGFGQNGQMREIDVGPQWLDILIDGTLDNCGYLPVDAEGVVPRRKMLVRGGKLVDAIHTRHTAKRAGKAPDGCARIQSLQHPSLNRMTSIWVCPENAKALEDSQVTAQWDDLPSEVIQKSLEKNGYLDGDRGVLLLSGWKGGTASCSNLEFRADVARVIQLKKNQKPKLMREANFTGIATECFRSAVDAFGPTLCRSIGTCGKDGQGVLTSDGGPSFMVFKPNSKVRVIGTGEGEVEPT